jgi:trk system potassium uptake protein TrkH
LNSAFKIIFKDIGVIFLVVAGLTCVVVIPAICFHEWDMIGGILIIAALYGGIGALLYQIFKEAPEPKLKHAMIIAALGWLLVALIGSGVFMVLAGMDFWSSFFESMSGWTGTGLTMIANPSQLPATLQFWRSLMQWVGGVGVILLTLVIIARPGTGSFTLYRSEAREEKIHPSIISTVRTIWWIYLLYTGISIGLFWLVGMPLWHAINHGMTCIATGGFSVVDGSVGNAAYNTALIEAAMLPIMLLGAIAFAAHYNLLKGRIRRFFSDPQTKALLALVVLGIGLLSIENLATYGGALKSFRYSAFQFISGLTCTGFQTADILAWHAGSKLLLALAMILGGAAGSTAGGIKLFRGILLTKGIGWRFRRMFVPPHGVYRYKLGKKLLSSEEAIDEVGEAAIVSFLWILCLIIGIIVLFHTISPLSGYGIEDILIEVCSAQGNAGLSTGITHQGIPNPSKLMLIINMWIGRLEIIPILVMFRTLVWPKVKF